MYLTREDDGKCVYISMPIVYFYYHFGPKFMWARLGPNTGQALT